MGLAMLSRLKAELEGECNAGDGAPFRNGLFVGRLIVIPGARRTSVK